MATGDRTAALVAAAGAPWESAALQALTGAGLVVLKRCVDLPDLLASAGSGQADVAVVSSELPGLDGAAVTHLLRHDVRTLAVVAVWGPAGAPGRTTVAVSLAAELSRRRRRVVLADVDPWGGSVAQHLGV